MLEHLRRENLTVIGQVHHKNIARKLALFLQEEVAELYYRWLENPRVSGLDPKLW